MDRTFFTCVYCKSDRFSNARRIFFLTLADGTLQRNWSADATDSTTIVCAKCGTVYVWNSVTKAYEMAR